MAERALTLVPKTYAELLRSVKATLFAGQRAADLAWVRTFHETGRLIHCHVLLKKDRADYGAQVVSQLARDTGTDHRRLYECRQFYRCFLNFRLTGKLGWTRGLLLSSVLDDDARETLVTEVLQDDLPTDALKARVRALNAAGKESADAASKDTAPTLLKSTPGLPGLHPIVDRRQGPAIDLGFMIYQALSAEQAKRWSSGDMVRWDDRGVRKITDATNADLFTYQATLKKVIDGDTLLVAAQLAPLLTKELKLRLRGLDCPEISTAAGGAAKAFVEKLLKPGDEIILRTTKPDKYDRYLADVFLRPPGGGDELFLNNALLAGGYAVRYDGGAKEG